MWGVGVISVGIVSVGGGLGIVSTCEGWGSIISVGV